MSKIMEEMCEEALFQKNVEHILMCMKKLGWTREKALEFYEIPENDYPKYLPLLGNPC